MARSNPPPFFTSHVYLPEDPNKNEYPRSTATTNAAHKCNAMFFHPVRFATSVDTRTPTNNWSHCVPKNTNYQYTRMAEARSHQSARNVLAEREIGTSKSAGGVENQPRRRSLNTSGQAGTTRAPTHRGAAVSTLQSLNKNTNKIGNTQNSKFKITRKGPGPTSRPPPSNIGHEGPGPIFRPPLANVGHEIRPDEYKRARGSRSKFQTPSSECRA